MKIEGFFNGFQFVLAFALFMVPFFFFCWILMYFHILLPSIICQFWVQIEPQ